jgi:hypothetical protein
MFMFSAAALKHDPLMVQLPVTSPPQGATFAQLPLPPPQADTIGIRATEKTTIATVVLAGVMCMRFLRLPLGRK